MQLLMVHEREETCRDRLIAEGIEPARANEVVSYLAQVTDITPDLPAIAAAAARRGIDFAFVELDDFLRKAPALDPRASLVWLLTDGFFHYRGSVAASLASALGLRLVGGPAANFQLCQDKFRSGLVLAAHGVPVPQGALARDGVWRTAPPPDAGGGWFVKPNRLGSKIGIWPESHVRSLDAALDLSRRIFAAWRDEAVVQAYVPGENVRVSFLDLPGGGHGMARINSGGDFQTMADSLALYGETGAAAKASGTYSEPVVDDLADRDPALARAVGGVVEKAASALGLLDVWSMDLRVAGPDKATLIEFEVAPGLPCFDFRHHIRARFGLELPEAIAALAAQRIEDIT